MMGCCFGSFDDDYDYRRDNYSYQAGNSGDRQPPTHQRTGPEESQVRLTMLTCVYIMRVMSLGCTEGNFMFISESQQL